LRKEEVLNFRARGIQQSARVGVDSVNTPYTNAGLRGDDQVVGIADTGIDRSSCYFNDSMGNVPLSELRSPVTNLNARKIVQYTHEIGAGDGSDEFQGHGTHVCGTVVGSIESNSDLLSITGRYSGVAPNAKVAFVDLGTPGSGIYVPSTAAALFNAARSAGARIYTNSWGALYSTGSFYSASDLDNYLYVNPDSTVLFAAGNNGQDGGGNGFASCSMEAQGKNVIAVGSSESTLDSYNISYVSWFSSKGPSFDGRIKPDIVGPGDSLVSAQASGSTQQTCDSLEMMGTSMASPAVAGAALIVRQYFMGAARHPSLWKSSCALSNYANCAANTLTPSGVLIKALLLHSGSAMSLYDGGGGPLDTVLNQTPDFTQGYGRVNLANIIPLTTNVFDLFVDDLHLIKEYSTIAYSVNIQSFQKPLK